MREVKFRAWDKEQKCMWYGGYVNFGAPLQTDVTDLHQTKVGKYPRKESALMQFTGLKDKNGKEIYEGDIVDIEDETCEVKFNAPSFAAYNSLNHEWNIQFAGIKVIGNIYENPDLIGGARV